MLQENVWSGSKPDFRSPARDLKMFLLVRVCKQRLFFFSTSNIFFVIIKKNNFVGKEIIKEKIKPKKTYEEGIDVGDGVESLLEFDAALLERSDEFLEAGAFVDGFGFLLPREIAEGHQRLRDARVQHRECREVIPHISVRRSPLENYFSFSNLLEIVLFLLSPRVCRSTA